MPLELKDVDARVRRAVASYWKTLAAQSRRQTSGDPDRGGRAAVTGGKQMEGFCGLVRKLLTDNGLPEAHIHSQARLELPGYFRASKSWDMLVVHDGRLVAALEFKSQRGPSFGNNFNNRTEEAIGTAVDLWTAFREGAFGPGHPRPWLGWVMLLEDCPRSARSVDVEEPHFPVFPEFRGASYARRYELLLRKLVLEKLYDNAALLLSTPESGPGGSYTEPSADLSMRRLLAGLAGHAVAAAAGA
ncbi:MAG: restriction endonuclease [Deltaproteobacteria bacterium]|nr:restriction endonuclease [Deltaproteobacteria bacterium]